jgi:ATP synthase protein I
MNQPADRRPDPTKDAAKDRDGLQEAAAWNVVAYLMSGVLGFGVPAWLLDTWLGTSWLLPVGLIVGMGASLWLIWFRYGTYRS